MGEGSASIRVHKDTAGHSGEASSTRPVPSRNEFHRRLDGDFSSSGYLEVGVSAKALGRLTGPAMPT